MSRHSKFVAVWRSAGYPMDQGIYRRKLYLHEDPVPQHYCLCFPFPWSFLRGHNAMISLHLLLWKVSDYSRTIYSSLQKILLTRLSMIYHGDSHSSEEGMILWGVAIPLSLTPSKLSHALTWLVHPSPFGASGKWGVLWSCCSHPLCLTAIFHCTLLYSIWISRGENMSILFIGNNIKGEIIKAVASLIFF